jgi:hypothetical protein
VWLCDFLFRNLLLTFLFVLPPLTKQVLEFLLKHLRKGIDELFAVRMISMCQYSSRPVQTLDFAMFFFVLAAFSSLKQASSWYFSVVHCAKKIFPRRGLVLEHKRYRLMRCAQAGCSDSIKAGIESNESAPENAELLSPNTFVLTRERHVGDHKLWLR